MKERPIIFSAPMVRAILEGRKTQTRRIVKPQPIERDEITTVYGGFHVGRLRDSENAFREIHCPHGRPGDRLWVREGYRLLDHWGTENYDTFMFSAYEDGERGRTVSLMRESCPKPGKHPSIHMPRWASRIDLEITDVRVQRVQDITEEDAKSEGVDCVVHNGMATITSSHIDQFFFLWDSINAKRGYGWDTNPWVWALTFKRIK